MVFRGDPVPREMVQNRRDVAVAAVTYRDQQDTLGRYQKRQGGGQRSHGLWRTVPRDSDKSADFGWSLRRREQYPTAGSRQDRFDRVAGGLVDDARRAPEHDQIEKTGARRY